MSHPDAPLQLSTLTPVARGSERRIYLHPHRPDRLLKVLEIRLPQSRVFSLRRWSGALLPGMEIRASLAEQKAQADAFLRAAPGAGLPPFGRLYGYLCTDVGWALESERITEGERPLGPTLRDIADAGDLTPELVELLNDTVRRIQVWNLRASDLHPRNFVLGVRDGRRQFVLVDGLGDIHAIPVRTWSDRLNRLANDYEFRRHAPRLGLRWDRRAQRYRLA